MIETEIIESGKGIGMGLQLELGYRKPSLLVIQADNGYLGCGYLNEETIEKVEDTAVLVSGVSDFDEMLEKKVSWISSKARKLGVKKGMTGEEALEIFSE